MKKSTRAGDLVKIPFDDFNHTYARILVEGSYAVYDCRSSSDIKDYSSIIESDILFTAHIDISAIKEGYWTVIENIPLEDNLIKFYPRYFNADPANPININFYRVCQEEIENAIKKDWIKTGKIQLDGIYGRLHIEKRISDYYAGKRNDDNKNSILFFKKLAGIQLEPGSKAPPERTSSNELNRNAFRGGYSSRLEEVKNKYPFPRWKKLFEEGFEKYSPSNRHNAQLILDNLIKDLVEIGEHAPEELKAKLLVESVKAFNQLNDRNEGILIETDEREELRDFFNQLTIAVGLNPSDYGDGEGVTGEHRDW
ncbi:Imm26 family immunity protein [Anaerocolumna jejuensis]|uniref:Imm26 family immunity protein n=1 Tax=Anaerocolumna jejuensis TaxID=259063 RepID=UPI003F7BF26B